MKNHARRALVIATAASVLAGCGTSLASSEDQSAAVNDAVDMSATAVDPAVAGENQEPHGNADDYDYDEDDVVAISLGDTISATSDDVTIDGTTATITAAGAYELTGALADGQIVVEAGDDDVQLILDGANITNNDGAAIAVSNADTAVVVLADGSANSLADGSSYDLPDGDDEPNATLFSSADLSIGGSGSLSVDGNYNDGIASKDGLVIDGGEISVDALDDAIRGKDYIVVRDGDITVTAEGDGLTADNDEDADRGYIDIAGGSIDVEAGDDGLQAATDVLISDGTLRISAVDDGVKGEYFVTIDGGSIQVTDSFEGIEAEVITINDGSIDITSNDDGLNVAAADTTASATDTTDAAEMTVPDPAEAATALPQPPDGAMGRPAPPAGAPGGPATAGDDAVVTPGGPAGGPGAGAGGDAGVGEHYLYINGGTTVITVTGELAEQGDGIDANGHVVMTGGLVVISGATDTRNSAIDYSGGSFVMNGGTLVGTNIDGRNSEGVGTGSSQASVYAALGTVADAGALVHLRSESGQSLVTFAPDNPFDVIVFSSPDLVAGESYEVYLGGTSSGDSTTGLYDDYEPGALIGTTTAY